MKYTYSLVIIFLFLSCIAKTALCSEASHGFYVESKSSELTITYRNTVNGKKENIHIEKQDDLNIIRKKFISVSNKNDKFILELHLPLEKIKRYLFYFDGKLFKPVDWGRRGNEGRIRFVIHDRKRAENISEYLSANIYYRKRPEYSLNIDFKPKKRSYENGEPILITFTVENIGESAIGFLDGCRDRTGDRCNLFNFFGRKKNGDLLQQVEVSGVTSGGIATRKTLTPGETCKKTINLLKWYTFDAKGMYEFYGIFRMKFTDSSEIFPYRDNFVTWEYYAADLFEFYINVSGFREENSPKDIPEKPRAVNSTGKKGSKRYPGDIDQGNTNEEHTKKKNADDQNKKQHSERLAKNINGNEQIFNMSFQSDLYVRMDPQIYVKVWRPLFQSVPGHNYQVIQVFDDSDILLKEEITGGGDPLFLKAWAKYFKGNVYVYILCEHRWGQGKGTYVYIVKNSGDSVDVLRGGVLFDEN